MDEIKQNQMKLIQALRSGNYKQYKGNYYGPDDSVCLFGLVRKLFFTLDYPPINTQEVDVIGVPVLLGRALALMNDSGHTFTQLADILINDYNFAEPAMDYKLKVEQEELTHV